MRYEDTLAAQRHRDLLVAGEISARVKAEVRQCYRNDSEQSSQLDRHVIVPRRHWPAIKRLWASSETATWPPVSHGLVLRPGDVDKVTVRATSKVVTS